MFFSSKASTISISSYLEAIWKGVHYFNNKSNMVMKESREFVMTIRDRDATMDDESYQY